MDPGWKKTGSGTRDGKNSDPGSGINIPDPQHCFLTSIFRVIGIAIEYLNTESPHVFRLAISPYNHMDRQARTRDTLLAIVER
jgi:hypothetical protein